MQKFFSHRIWLLNNAESFHDCNRFSSWLRFFKIFQTFSWRSFSIENPIYRFSSLKLDVLFWANTKSVFIKFFMHSKVIHWIFIIEVLIMTFSSKLSSLLTSLFTQFCSSSLWRTHLRNLWWFPFYFFFSIVTTWIPKIRCCWICPFINSVH